MLKKDGLLTNRKILEIQKVLEQNNAGFRTHPGTELKNGQSGEVVYTPPQGRDDIVKLMSNLEVIINDNDYMPDMDILTKMAIIHHQFESIHPFYDGNGRTGRIINVLYLVQKDLLTIPILYLSSYIIKTKSDYYRLLQNVRDTGKWEEWVLYILQGIIETSQTTAKMVAQIRDEMLRYKHEIRDKYPFYTQDLINNLGSRYFNLKY